MIDTPINDLSVSAYPVPADQPEVDRTLEWNSTTLVLVEVSAGGETGLGYSYASATTGRFIEELLAEVVKGKSALDIPGSWNAMVHTVRNQGRAGVSSMAISAVRQRFVGP